MKASFPTSSSSTASMIADSICDTFSKLESSNDEDAQFVFHCWFDIQFERDNFKINHTKTNVAACLQQALTKRKSESTQKQLKQLANRCETFINNFFDTNVHVVGREMLDNWLMLTCLLCVSCLASFKLLPGIKHSIRNMRRFGQIK